MLEACYRAYDFTELSVFGFADATADKFNVEGSVLEDEDIDMVFTCHVAERPFANDS